VSLNARRRDGGHRPDNEHAQPLDPEDAQLAVDHRPVFALHVNLAAAERVMDADPGRRDVRVRSPDLRLCPPFRRAISAAMKECNQAWLA
jgi:hypothetical protein